MERTQDGRVNRGRSKAADIAALIALVAAVVLLVKVLYPVDLPVNGSPTFIDTIFANRLVVWTARLLLVSAAAVIALGGMFIAGSIGSHMKSGHWLRRAGPFEVPDRPPEQASDEMEVWRAAALEGRTIADQLQKELREADHEIERLCRTMDDGQSITYDP